MLKLLGLSVLLAGLAAVPSALSDSSVWYRDPAGDVRPTEPDAAPFVAGPDIRFMRATRRSDQIGLEVVFGQAPPLANSEREQYSEWLSIAIWAKGKVGGYASHLIDIDARRQVDFTKDGWKTSTKLKPAVVSRKTVTISLPARLIGNPKTIRFSVTARRDGKSSSYDRVPDNGTASLTLR